MQKSLIIFRRLLIVAKADRPKGICLCLLERHTDICLLDRLTELSLWTLWLGGWRDSAVETETYICMPIQETETYICKPIQETETYICMPVHFERLYSPAAAKSKRTGIQIYVFSTYQRVMAHIFTVSTAAQQQTLMTLAVVS